MTSTRARGAMWTAAILVLASAAAPAAATASALDLYYQRAVMSAADGRCRLFTPDIASALNAAKAQARGAALRGGVDAADVAQATARAQASAARSPCNSRDLATAAGRVRAAFDSYSRMLRLNLPGETTAWRADRTLPIDGPVWRLAQTTTLGSAALTFGLTGQRGETPQLTAMSDFGGGPQPYAARLLIRDQDRAPQPYLSVWRQGASAQVPLRARTAPRPMNDIYPAGARGPADWRLLAPKQKSATTFGFPAAAIDAIGALDPREAITVEFLYSGPSGDIARQAYVEVGDFAAGQAFLTIAQR